jgi:hypothetical protein
MEPLHPCFHQNAYDIYGRIINAIPYRKDSSKPILYHQYQSNIETNEVNSPNYYNLKKFELLKKQVEESTFEREEWREKEILLKNSFNLRCIKFKEDIFRKSMELDKLLKEKEKLVVQVEEQLNINEDNKKNHESLIEFLRKEFIKHVGDALEEKENIAKKEASLKLGMQELIQEKDEKLLDLKTLNTKMLKAIEDKENERKMSRDEAKKKIKCMQEQFNVIMENKTMNSKRNCLFGKKKKLIY